MSARPALSIEKNLLAFENKIEALRQKYHIPSLSVGIVNKKQLAWYKGFGFADMENNIVPDQRTIYHLASVTKTFASIILMQLEEAGKLRLDDPVTKYDIQLGARWGGDNRIQIRHLLTHTSMGNTMNGFKPGYSFRYNGDFYGHLRKAIEKSSGKTFGELLVNAIILPLHMEHTVPNLYDTMSFSLTGYERNDIARTVAKPYDWVDKKIVNIEYPTYFGPSAGLKDVTFIVLANAQDLSRPFYPKINPLNMKLSKNVKKSPFGKAFFDLINN